MLVEIKCSESLIYNANLVEAKTASTNLTWLYLYFHISIRIFCTLLIWFVLDGILETICFLIFYSKHSITFENAYLLSCWFDFVDNILHRILILWNFHSSELRN